MSEAKLISLQFSEIRIGQLFYYLKAGHYYVKYDHQTAYEWHGEYAAMCSYSFPDQKDECIIEVKE